MALDAPDGDWHLTEGEADALAIAAALLDAGELGRVVCASGTSGWNPATCDAAGERRIVLHPDSDGPGLATARRLREGLRSQGRPVRVERSRRDPAADRAAMRPMT